MIIPALSFQEILGFLWDRGELCLCISNQIITSSSDLVRGASYLKYHSGSKASVRSREDVEFDLCLGFFSPGKPILSLVGC